MIVRRAAWLGVVLAVAPACARETPPPADVAIDLEVGAHRMRASIPAGWEIVDQGSQKRFRRNESEIVLQDLGPATPSSNRREVERASELWKTGRVAEAQLRVSNVSVPDEWFPTADARLAFQSARKKVSDKSASDKPIDEIEAAFLELTAALAALPPPSLDALANRGLAAVGHDQRRDVKSRREVALDGRDAEDIETWTRLSHTYPQRMLFVEDDGDLLVLYTPREGDT